MKNQNQFQFSPKDIVDLMNHAKQLGVAELKVGDFAISFAARTAAPAGLPQASEEPKCKCGNPLKKGDYGYFPRCDSCHFGDPEGTERMLRAVPPVPQTGAPKCRCGGPRPLSPNGGYLRLCANCFTPKRHEGADFGKRDR